ncbi:uncharacterized protein LOC120839344 [Ixodes scapularis]|uniref:uncharacterized protein LOC120839344 n=1 Tax=Ixodes scapularis TaxID=6945 RepID=UPI001A9E95A4|nr:uncharacterized protein LOC120839344 [Ixodes scapularis]
MGNDVLCDWKNFIREAVADEMASRPPLGGVGQVVQVDESLFRGKRKYNRGRLLAGDNVPGCSSDHYRGTEEKGPWIVGLISESTGELRLFEVKKRNRRTLHAIVAKNVYPGTTVVTDKWKGYDGLWTVHDDLGHMVLNHLTVNHSENFVDPETGAHTQKIESAWTALKQDLLKRGKGTSKTLLPSHLTWYWWNSINGRTRCRDPFLRLLEAIDRKYPCA